MILLVDDKRSPDGVDLIARNYNSAVHVLSQLHVDWLILDHDLGIGKTGADLLAWLLALPQSQWIRDIQLCSMNPVGLHRMQNMLRAAGYRALDGGIVWRYEE